MALWKWTGCGYEKASLHTLNMGGLKAMVYGTGESLNDSNYAPEGYMRFVMNYAVKKVEPHVFVSMDDDFYKPEYLNTPYRKIFRGNYCDKLVDTVPVKEFPEAYFADVPAGLGKDAVFFNRGLDTQFYFGMKTICFTLHLILYMGFKHIAFAGCDFGGKYCDEQYGIMTEREVRTLNEEFEFMKWLVPVCKMNGITLENTSKTSRLNELIKG